jgi:hypothetical protein
MGEKMNPQRGFAILGEAPCSFYRVVSLCCYAGFIAAQKNNKGVSIFIQNLHHRTYIAGILVSMRAIDARRAKKH